jgi:hypothetical protein
MVAVVVVTLVAAGFEIVSAGGLVTVTVAVPVAEPAEFVAVRVYVVVAAGETLRVPEAATVPIP